MIYRVSYPLITQDAHRDFPSMAEAMHFANEQRNRSSPYLTVHSWRRVGITEIAETQADIDFLDEKALKMKTEGR